MWNRFCMMALLTAAVCILLGCCLVQLEQRELSCRLIRLHVKAASDSVFDQEVKLRVRDAVLPQIKRLTADCGTAAQAEKALTGALPELGQTALAELHRLDPTRELAVSLQKESAPTREYDTFLLPAGSYRALRFTLGAGEGHNWWCVAFPALCLPATAEGFDEAAQTAGFDVQQRALMQGEGTNVRLKLRILEWLQELFGSTDASAPTTQNAGRSVR